MTWEVIALAGALVVGLVVGAYIRPDRLEAARMEGAEAERQRLERERRWVEGALWEASQ